MTDKYKDITDQIEQLYAEEFEKHLQAVNTVTIPYNEFFEVHIDTLDKDDNYSFDIFTLLKDNMTKKQAIEKVTVLLAQLKEI